MKWRVADWHFSSLIIICCSFLTSFGYSVMEVRRSDGESSVVEDDLCLQLNVTACTRLIFRVTQNTSYQETQSIAYVLQAIYLARIL